MTTDTPITAAAYADLVRAELADLPPDDLASMVEDPLVVRRLRRNRERRRRALLDGAAAGEHA